VSRLIAAVVVFLGLTACGLAEPKCSQGEACRGTSGQCYKCDAPYSCNSGGTCSSTTDGVACCNGGGGGGSNLYVSANGCTGGATYSYSGTSSSTCYSYYNAAVAASCTKILWKCN
jgi:hypothetical protein